VIVICGDVSKTFMTTTTRVEDDLKEIIWRAVSTTAKQKHRTVSSSMFTCQACLRAVGGHLQHVLQQAESYITEPVNVVPSMAGFAHSMSGFRFMPGIVYNTPSEYSSLSPQMVYLTNILICNKSRLEK
jgi:hypothetical protein